MSGWSSDSANVIAAKSIGISRSMRVTQREIVPGLVHGGERWTRTEGGIELRGRVDRSDPIGVNVHAVRRVYRDEWKRSAKFATPIVGQRSS